MLVFEVGHMVHGNMGGRDSNKYPRILVRHEGLVWSSRLEAQVLILAWYLSHQGWSKELSRNIHANHQVWNVFWQETMVTYDHRYLPVHVATTKRSGYQVGPFIMVTRAVETIFFIPFSKRLLSLINTRILNLENYGKH